MSNLFVTVDPEVMSGAAVFASTRVPVRTLFDYLESGETVDDFLEGFPSVKREQVVHVLDQLSAKAPELAN